MARFLVDEMFPRAVCPILHDLGHDAVHVRDLGLEARPDPEVAAAAGGGSGRVLVTENVKDFAGERELTVVCVLKSRLVTGGMARRLADSLHDWAVKHLHPYVGLHWP